MFLATEEVIQLARCLLAQRRHVGLFLIHGLAICLATQEPTREKFDGAEDTRESFLSAGRGMFDGAEGTRAWSCWGWVGK